MKRLCFLILACVIGVCVLTAQNTNSRSGRCNGDLEWSFDGRVLTLSKTTTKKPTVKIPDYDLEKNLAPWVKQNLDVRSVIIGRGIQRIGSCAFANCKELKKVEFQDISLTEIGWGAFLNCRGLYDFSIPVSIKRIETIAFANCSGLLSVTIPSLTRVEDQAFLSCTSLSMIDIADNASLGKAVFATEVVENGQTVHKCYDREIRNLPHNINTINCTEYGLDVEAVSICLKNSQPYQNEGRVSTVDTEIPEARIMRNDTYALIIGNEHYRFVSDVPFAANDARIFAEYCKKTLGVPMSNVHLCEDATKHMILEQELEDWLKNEVIDRNFKKLIVYYAGHGVPDGQDNNKAYLLPTDVYGTKPHQGIALDQFYALLGNLGFSQVTVFIDACFSGVNRDNQGLSVERAVEVEAQDTRPTIGNLVVFSAAHGNETAQSYQEEGHGLFTYYLLKELQETQGLVTFGKLSDDINEHVTQVAPTMDLRKKQTPQAFSSSSNDRWRKMTF